MNMKKVRVVGFAILVGAAIGINLFTAIKIKENPSEPPAQTTVDPIDKGKDYLLTAEYDEAINEFTKAIRTGIEEKNPDRNPYLLRSIAYRHKGDDDGAETDLAKANEQIGALQLEFWMQRHKDDL